MKKYIFNILLIIIWMFIIFSFSSQNGEQSQTTSDNFIIKILSTITTKEISLKDKAKITKTYSKIIRKIAHFTAYFILAILVYRLNYKIYGLFPKTLLYTIIFCFIYACSDEIHQSFICGRSCEFLDVIIDSGGAFISTLIMSIFHRKRIK